MTRAEIEDIRGVTMSKGTIDVLLETGWIRPRGRRKAPGRPITYGTTEAFLSHFGLEQLSDLPGLDELKGSGLLDGRLPPGFAVPMPSDDPALRDDEDPLEPGDLDLGLAPRPEHNRGVRICRAAMAIPPRSGAVRGGRTPATIAARLTYENVTHRYGDVVAVRDFSLDIGAGRDRVPARALRLRQDHAAAACRRRRGAAHRAAS